MTHNNRLPTRTLEAARTPGSPGSSARLVSVGHRRNADLCARPGVSVAFGEIQGVGALGMAIGEAEAFRGHDVLGGLDHGPVLAGDAQRLY